jgi:hypothetical protein
MDGNITAILVGIGLFLAGMFAKGKYSKRSEVKEDVERAKKQELEGTADAEQRYDARVEAAKAKAKEAIDGRPVTGDPVADLADRIRRHRKRRKGRQRVGFD